MNLSSIEAEFAARWLHEHCLPRPATSDDADLTWYVTGNTIYTSYVNGAYAANVRPLSFNELWTVMQLVLPGVRAQKLRGEGIYTGIRLYLKPPMGGLKF